MKKLILLLNIILTTQLGLYAQNDSKNRISETNMSILFVGNSLTYSNDLPTLVKKIAKEHGVKIDVNMVAFPNYALIDHWNEGKVQKKIGKKEYNFVIIQQGPSSGNEGRNMLIEYGKKISELSGFNDAKLCYFMVWPSLTNYHTFDRVINNYKEAAAVNNAILIPVGAVWKQHFDTTKDFKFYDADGFHPSEDGSRMAAKVIFESLLKE